jgi:hypothetical protein
LDEHERRVRRKWRGVVNESEKGLAQRESESHAGEHLATLRDRRRRRDPRRRQELAGRVTARLDPRVMAGSDAPNRGAIVRHDRTLKIERCRELAGLGTQVRAHGCESGGGDARPARQLRRRLLGVRPVRVAIEREDDRGQQRAYEDENEEGRSNHRRLEPTSAGPQGMWRVECLHRLLPQGRASFSTSATATVARSPGGVRVNNRASSGRH